MNRLLLGTALVLATPAVAAADIIIGGYARYGADYDEARAPADETRIESRFRLIITARTQADNGLNFGAQVRYQANEAGTSVAGTAGFNNPRFWVESGALAISLGNVLGAIDSMPGIGAGDVGLTGVGSGHEVYTGIDAYESGGQGREGFDVTWSGDAFSAHLSHSSDQIGFGVNGTVERTALHLAYSVGGYTVAVAGQDSNVPGDTRWVLTASGGVGPANLTLQAADNDGAAKYGLAGEVEVGAATRLIGYVNHDEAINDENLGIGFRHGLGGGASLRGGVADLGGRTRADLGVRFNF